jgi:hypothetical protein
MQTIALRSLCILILSTLSSHKVYCSFEDVTSKVGISSIDGLVAAFGDFNGDKSTDLFVITNQGNISLNLKIHIFNILRFLFKILFHILKRFARDMNFLTMSRMITTNRRPNTL